MAKEDYAFDSSTPDDLRRLGWRVAVHNDYRFDGKDHTFWLMTKTPDTTRRYWEPMKCLKGEGQTDAEALNQIRMALYDAETMEARRNQ